MTALHVELVSGQDRAVPGRTKPNLVIHEDQKVPGRRKGQALGGVPLGSNTKALRSAGGIEDTDLLLAGQGNELAVR